MDNISNTLQQSLTQLITSLMTIVGVIVMMLTISPWLTLICLVTLPLSAVVTMRDRQALARAISSDSSDRSGELNGHVEEMYAGHRIIKAFGREQRSIERFDKHQRAVV